MVMAEEEKEGTGILYIRTDDPQLMEDFKLACAVGKASQRDVTMKLLRWYADYKLKGSKVSLASSV
jgi:hypothetical protein